LKVPIKMYSHKKWYHGECKHCGTHPLIIGEYSGVPICSICMFGIGEPEKDKKYHCYMKTDEREKSVYSYYRKQWLLYHGYEEYIDFNPC